MSIRRLINNRPFFRYIQQLVDQVEESIALSQYHTTCLFQFLLCRQRSVGHLSAKTQYYRQRRAELVCDIHEEMVLGSLYLYLHFMVFRPDAYHIPQKYNDDCTKQDNAKTTQQKHSLDASLLLNVSLHHLHLLFSAFTLILDADVLNVLYFLLAYQTITICLAFFIMNESLLVVTSFETHLGLLMIQGFQILPCTQLLGYRLCLFHVM